MNSELDTDTPDSYSSQDHAKWYVAYTMGYEDKIRQQILKRAENMEAADKILEVFVPKKSVAKVKAGKRVEKEMPRYQQYVFVRMIMDEHTFRVVRNTPGVLDVIDKPLSPAEVARLFGRARKVDTPAGSTRYSVDFAIGDEVRVEGGAFHGFSGEAQSLDLENGKVTVMLNLLGRQAPVELTVDQVLPVES
jgi:transcriptional antiterminator NusG